MCTFSKSKPTWLKYRCTTDTVEDCLPGHSSHQERGDMTVKMKSCLWSVHCTHRLCPVVPTALGFQWILQWCFTHTLLNTFQKPDIRLKSILKKYMPVSVWTAHALPGTPEGETLEASVCMNSPCSHTRRWDTWRQVMCPQHLCRDWQLKHTGMYRNSLYFWRVPSSRLRLWQVEGNVGFIKVHRSRIMQTIFRRYMRK